MSRLKFNKKDHHYTLDNKPITGVTTILSVISKPALINWAANQAVDYIRDKIADQFQKEKILPRLDLPTILEEARKAHRQKRDKAGDIGTIAHLLIDDWIKNGKKTIEVSDQVKDKQDAQKITEMVLNFINWATENKLKFLASEQQVYSEKYWFCGTYDFLAKIDNKIYLGDVKTSSNIYPEMWAQCSGYQICEQEMNPKQKIDGHLIVNLKKDGKIQTKTSYDYAGYRKMFLGALAIYRQLNNGKQKNENHSIQKTK